jgi:hypothetical protein
VSPALQPPARLQTVTLCVVVPDPAFCRAEFQPSTKIGAPGSVTLTGVKLAVRLAEEMDADRFTVPLNPLRLNRVRLDVAEDPCTTVTLAGLAVMEKSGFGEALTVTETVVE